VLVAVAGLGAAACSADDDSGADSASDAPTVMEAPAGDGRAGDPAARPADVAAGEVAATDRPSLPVGRALATTAGVTVTTPDIRRAADDTVAAVARHDATVFDADVTIGSERDDGSVDGVGWFVVKVPPAELEPLVDDLAATVGTVSSRTQETADVTDQLVDLEIRIGVERDVIARFRALLDDATEFQDVVDIERVIAERTVALEQLLAAQRNLEDRVELSTLRIQLEYAPPAPEPAERDSDTITDAWRAGWEAFVGVFFTVALILAVASPFLVTAGVLLGVAWLVVRRRRASAPVDGGAGGPLVDDPVSATGASLAAPTREG
jgi:hypothetical protein